MKAFATIGTIITLSLFIFTAAHAQTDSAAGIITGKITDANKAPVNGATVYINRRSDSSLVKVALTNETGNFVFDHLKRDTVVITVTYIGYIKYASTPIVIDGSTQIPEIQLIRNDGNTLAEVVVTEKKKFIERKVDRTIVNVGAYLSNIGTNAVEVLEKAPGVRIDQFGDINLLGKGVTVYIDGRSTYLSNADLINYLRSMPSDMLDKIELMPVPPSKFDASGAGGVINIITKKNRRRGFNGNVNGSYGQGVYDKTNGNLWLNYRNRKMNLFGNY
ncbi:MAG TPA: carboxypeptidase regulatory-like domain-containing protein, partial [Ferruginibacter sp.]|nr:carboxypeptidase regulatory-like domain-containing protein [Ferruginibacter sp.]